MDNETKLARDTVRFTRNRLLYESDWTQLADTVSSQELKTEWAVYRQQLRDLTTQSGFPLSIDWPVCP